MLQNYVLTLRWWQEHMLAINILKEKFHYADSNEHSNTFRTTIEGIQSILRSADTLGVKKCPLIDSIR